MNGKQLKKEYGDYQTPVAFAKKVCDYLKIYDNVMPEVIIEPTCGVGNFLEAALGSFETVQKAYAVEINSNYCHECESRFHDSRVTFYNSDFFKFDLNKFNDHGKTGQKLVIGNPPWVTNAELAVNLPPKSNFKQMSGIEAITGAGNFDICESIIIRLIEKYKYTNTILAMLCKTSVARNIFSGINKKGYKFCGIKFLNFDATKIFSVSANACVLVINLNRGQICSSVCNLYDFDNPGETLRQVVFSGGTVTPVMRNVDIEGKSQFEWRQGIKHDCAKVVELKQLANGSYQNKGGEIVALEGKYIYPLLKSSNIKKAIMSDNFSRRVLVTQQKSGEDTFHIAYDAPLTWEYLTRNKAFFDSRKSVIYKKAPQFGMFGIGNYSYARYKVAVSGFYKSPLFALVYNGQEPQKPVMLDDTVYFLSFENYDMAYCCMLLLNSNRVQKFLTESTFLDAKRPYTKKLLQRVDLVKCMQSIAFGELSEAESRLRLPRYITHHRAAEFFEMLTRQGVQEILACNF